MGVSNTSTSELVTTPQPTMNKSTQSKPQANRRSLFIRGEITSHKDGELSIKVQIEKE